MEKELDPLNERIVILLSREEKAFFKQVARDEGRSMSGHARYIILQEIDRRLDDD